MAWTWIENSNSKMEGKYLVLLATTQSYCVSTKRTSMIVVPSLPTKGLQAQSTSYKVHIRIKNLLICMTHFSKRLMVPQTTTFKKKNHESEWELAFAPLFLLYPSLSLLASVGVLMEESGRAVIGSRQSDLNKSFKLAIRSLLTTCSKEVITSLHENIENEFESLCLETQVGAALDTVEQFVEEQNLDPLFSEKTNVMDVVCDLTTAKKNEICYLTCILERVEEQNRLLKARLELLKKGRQDFSGMTEVVEKLQLRSGIAYYGTYNNGFHDPELMG
ncbi:polyamine-modulated factor 1 [Citrus sinensis]|nr:polyamine-modulated factor 1 [Citrus sinensis]